MAGDEGGQTEQIEAIDTTLCDLRIIKARLSVAGLSLWADRIHEGIFRELSDELQELEGLEEAVE